MIVVDTSALIAILKNETRATACQNVLETTDVICMSAGTLSEALIVSLRQNRLSDMRRLLDGLTIEIVGVSEENSQNVAAAYARCGKGMHPAGLNFGDCFAYSLAKELDCPLLFVADDFAQTDIRSAIPA